MNSKISATIKVYVPANEAKATPPLGPILGQNQINMMEFIKDFNGRSEVVQNGIELRVSILKFLNGKKEYRLLFPKLEEVIYQLCGEGNRSISKHKIQDLIRIQLHFFENFQKSTYNDKIKVMVAKKILGTLSSMNFKIV